MAKKDRCGKKNTRDRRVARRIPEMGYYLVVTDTEATERCYFTGLHNSLPDEIRNKLVIKVVETKTQNLIEKCKELTAYEPQYRIPWIIFDRDRVPNFDRIISDAERSGINAGWSNPCFEIWMFGYFGSITSIADSWTCCSKFSELYEKKTGREYIKSDPDMYARLQKNGNEENALKYAKLNYDRNVESGVRTPSKMSPCTTVHKLVGEIRNKASHEIQANEY